MIYRISCVAVVVFWLVMTTMLVVRSYYSSEDNLPVIPEPESVIDLFIENSSPSNLGVYRDREKVGSISVTPQELNNGHTRILLTALGRMKIATLGEQDIVWSGKLELNPIREVVRLDLSIKLRDPKVEIALDFDTTTFEFNYHVVQDGEILIDSEDKKSKVVSGITKMLQALGVSPRALKRKEARGESLGEGKEFVVRHGKVVIGSERQSAYILYLPEMRGKQFKVYFSEAGEILKVGAVDDRSMMGYEIISEVFNHSGDR